MSRRKPPTLFLRPPSGPQSVAGRPHPTPAESAFAREGKALDHPESILKPVADIDPPSPAPAVRVSGLTYAYPDGRRALDGVDLEIAPGESVALVGPNGAGKSTLLLHLNGLLPGRRGSSRRASPSVWIDGLDAVRDAILVRRKVGLLFQDPDDQLFSSTVLEDVAFGPLNLGMSKADARRTALECLERVDLAAAADRPPPHLSFGERKRVCLAGVLACGPSVLVLDEPTANLDPRGRRRFIALIASLPATKLIATHDLEMVLEVCPRTVLLDAGRVVADGPSRRLLDDAALLEAHGLERPLSLMLGRAGDEGPGPVNGRPPGAPTPP